MPSAPTTAEVQMSTFAHDVRSPLLTLRMGCDILAGSTLEPGLRDVIVHMRLAAARLRLMVDNVVIVQRLAAKALRTERRPTPLARVINDAAALVRPDAESLRQTIDVGPAGERTAMVDSEQLRLVLSNLLSNAIMYSPEGSTIAVRTAPTEDGRGVRVSVRDEGPGIAAADLEAIFRPYTRLPATAEGKPGLGLGLAVSRQLIEGLGGRLDVETEPGQGATFSVVLPLASG